jgi:thiol-disulfide isomerase/thioredoxin
MTARVLVVAAIVLLCLLGRWSYLRYRDRIESHRPDHPRLPDRLRHPSAASTWIVFTTPYCATCGPVTDKLTQTYPDAHVVTVDATEDPALADAFSVRSAPTVLLADADGHVTERFVGADAVNRYLAAV